MIPTEERSFFQRNFKEYGKALVAAVLAAVYQYLAVKDGGLDGTEIGTVVGAFLASFGVVYNVPNAKAPVEVDAELNGL